MTKIVMMGTGTFAEPTLNALLANQAAHPVVGVVTQPDRAAGQERGSTRQTGQGMKNIAQAHGIPVFQPESINTPEGIAGLQAFRPDLLVVAAYGQILSRDVLAVAPLGGINVHASLLPRYRGAAPIAWAIWHGEKSTGVTIIQMSVQLDAGGMLLQEAVDILPDETAGELEARLAPLGARMALHAIGLITSGTGKPIQQDKSLVTKAPKLTKEHGLIDWSRTAEQICNHVRAMQPWPTAYTFFHQQGRPPIRLIVVKAAPGKVAVGAPLPPGSVFADPQFPASFFVHAGAGGPVEVCEIQPAGKRRMSAGEFLRGHRLQPGDHVGPER